MNIDSKKEERLILGASINALGYLCISLMSAASKAVPSDIATINILFFQNLICLILILPSVFKHGWSSLKTEHPWLHLTRDICGVASFFALFIAIKYIPLIDALLLQNTAPLWIPFIVLFWVKKRISNHLWYSIGLGFVGVILILKPTADLFNKASIIGLLSGILLAISLVSIRRLKATEPTHRILFFYFLFGTLVSAPFALAQWSAVSWMSALMLIAVGVFMYLGQVLITYSYQHAKASTLSPISYSTILFAGILGFIFWNQVPDWTSLFGVALVILGGVMSIFMEQRLLKRVH